MIAGSQSIMEKDLFFSRKIVCIEINILLIRCHISQNGVPEFCTANVLHLYHELSKNFEVAIPSSEPSFTQLRAQMDSITQQLDNGADYHQVPPLIIQNVKEPYTRFTKSNTPQITVSIKFQPNRYSYVYFARLFIIQLFIFFNQFSEKIVRFVCICLNTVHSMIKRTPKSLLRSPSPSAVMRVTNRLRSSEEPLRKEGNPRSSSIARYRSICACM
jgi:hypothetical protein